MRSSWSDVWSRRAAGDRGTWLRLAVMVLLVVMLLLSSTVDLTGALLTDTVRTTTVVSTLPVFPTATATPG